MKVDPKKLKPVYKDRSRFPNVTDGYEGDLKKEYDQMLIKLAKDFGNKLSQILK